MRTSRSIQLGPSARVVAAARTYLHNFLHDGFRALAYDLHVIQKMNENGNQFFSIGYPGRDCLVIELLSPPADKETEGYEWISARATIQAGSFTGSTDLMISKGDLVRFKDELHRAYDSLSGGSVFSPIEDQVKIEVSVNGRGHVKVDGYLKDDPHDGNKLIYSYRYDQTLLWHTISEIDEALFEFEEMKG